MKREIALRLAKALRSGDYVQAKGILNRTSPARDAHGNDATVGHCCLGVLCELAVQDGLLRKKSKTEDDEVYTIYSSLENFDSGYAFPPMDVRDWAGLFQSNIFFDLTGDERVSGDEFRPHQEVGWDENDKRYIYTASTLNDTLGFSFDDIAELLENENYLSAEEARLFKHGPE